MITFPVVPHNPARSSRQQVKVLRMDLLGILPLAIERVTICKGTFARMDSYINILSYYKNLEPSCVSDSAFASFGVLWNSFGTETHRLSGDAT